MSVGRLGLGAVGGLVAGSGSEQRADRHEQSVPGRERLGPSLEDTTYGAH